MFGGVGWGWFSCVYNLLKFKLCSTVCCVISANFKAGESIFRLSYGSVLLSCFGFSVRYASARALALDTERVRAASSERGLKLSMAA